MAEPPPSFMAFDDRSFFREKLESSVRDVSSSAVCKGGKLFRLLLIEVASSGPENNLSTAESEKEMGEAPRQKRYTTEL